MIPTKNRRRSHSFGYFLVHFPSIWGIATTSVRTGLAMTTLFFKHQLLRKLSKTYKHKINNATLSRRDISGPALLLLYRHPADGCWQRDGL